MSEQVIKEVRAKFTADLSDFRKKVQEAGKVSQDLQDRISAVGDAAAAAQNITGAEMQKISRSLSSASRQAAALGKRAQSLAADESQLTRAIAEQEGSLSRMEAEYSSLQAESERLSGIFDTVKDAISGLNLSGTLTEELQKAQETLASYDNEIAQLRAKIMEASGMGYTSIQLDDGSIVSLQQAKQKLQEMTTAADQAAARVEQLSAAAQKVGQANMGYASDAGLKQLQTELGNTNSQMEQLALKAGQTASRMLTYQERLDQVKSKQREASTSAYELAYGIGDLEAEVASATAPTTLSQRLDQLLDSFQDGAWQTSLTQFQATMSDLFSWAGQMAGNTSFSDFTQGVGSAAQDAVAQFRQMTTSVQESRSAFAATRQTASALASALKSVASSAKSATVWSTIATAAGKVKTAFGQLATLAAGTLAIGLGKAASGLLKVGSAVGRLASSGLSAAVSGLSKLASALTGVAGKAGSAVLSGLQSLASRITSIGSSARSTADGGLTNMVRQIRNIGVVSLGLKVCSSLFGQLRSVVNNCVSSNESLSNQVEVLQNSLANALAPAISVVVNLLSRVMPYLVGIADAIASILTNLFGTGWTTVSTGLGSTASGAADAVSDVTDATNDAADAQKAYNKQILGFDEITKLEDNSSSGTSGSGGSSPSTSTGSGSSGLGSIAGILPEWLSNIMDLVKGGEWEALGVYLAERVGSAVDKIYDVLTGAETYAKVDSAVNALTTTINSFFRRMNLVDSATGDSIASKLGRTIGAALNLAAYTVNQTVTKIDWSEIGLTVANVINGAVEETDWGQIGETVANVFLVLPKTLGSAILHINWGQVGASVNRALTSAFNTVSNWLDSVDWSQVGEDVKTGISDALEKLDASEIVTSFSTMLGKAFGAIGTIINEVIIEPFTEWLTDWANWGAENGPYDDLGMNILYGILNGIVNAITGIGTWIYDNILTPFVEGFKSTFGISSPATNAELLSAAGYVGEGILNGIASVFTNIGTWVQENILTPFTESLSTLKENVSDKFSGALDGAVSAWNGAKSTFTKVKDNVVSGFSALKDNVKSKFSTALTGAQTAWSNAKTTFTTVKDNVVSGFSALKDNVSDKFSTAMTGAENAWSNAKTAFTTVSSNVVSGFKSLASNIKEKFKSAITAAKGLDWKGTGTDITSGILNGMYNWGSKLKSWASSLLSKAQSALGIASPSTLFRDKVGIFLGLGVAEGLEGSTGSVMDTVRNLASSVADGLNSIDTGVSLSAATGGLDSALDGFAETVTEGFTALIIDLRGLLEQAADMIPDLSGVTLPDVTSRAETGRNARSYTPIGSADEGWMDAVADRVAQRVSAQTGGQSGEGITITVPVYLDGKLVGQSAVTYINGEARRTGVNPLADYL